VLPECLVFHDLAFGQQKFLIVLLEDLAVADRVPQFHDRRIFEGIFEGSRRFFARGDGVRQIARRFQGFGLDVKVLRVFESLGSQRIGAGLKGFGHRKIDLGLFIAALRSPGLKVVGQDGRDFEIQFPGCAVFHVIVRHVRRMK
jgi:hypothetical protein